MHAATQNAAGQALDGGFDGVVAGWQNGLNPALKLAVAERDQGPDLQSCDHIGACYGNAWFFCGLCSMSVQRTKLAINNNAEDFALAFGESQRVLADVQQGTTAHKAKKKGVKTRRLGVRLRPRCAVAELGAQGLQAVGDGLRVDGFHGLDAVVDDAVGNAGWAFLFENILGHGPNELGAGGASKHEGSFQTAVKNTIGDGR